MGWRSVVIANPAALSLEDRALVVAQNGNAARVMLEDISVLILDHAQISLTAPLLAACAEAHVAVLTVNAAHLPNGVLLPYHPHSRALKVMLAQLAQSAPDKKRLWQRIVRSKISNQAAVLDSAGMNDEAHLLRQLAHDTRSGDPDNHEAQAAQVYFRALVHARFTRGQERFYNAALNYGYAVIRAAIARTLTAYGFLPAFGLFHHNEQNSFNLADDLIEPYRQYVDAAVMRHYLDEPQRELLPADKARMVALLHEDVALTSHSAESGRCTLLAAIEATVSSLSGIVVQAAGHESLALPRLELAPHQGAGA
ncbi:CRISPR-associated endonuclease Cas1 [mine drainage metagenome]|uniref:CRISPR-associated endonuclease Cas1 n=1 Tax=mine drainage metagenome TaxID=410659 RepID=A0A1J5QC85_9ZZZZ